MYAQISVIVPLYNVEAYIKACLDSLLLQSFGDFEVVIVNDGSTDDSALIAQKYAERDSRFRLVHQENGGLGNARNTGVKEARGAFYFFLDSDDVLPKDALENLYQAAVENNSDIVTGFMVRFTKVAVSQSGLHNNSGVFTQRRINTNMEETPELFFDTCACNKLYRADFWQKTAMKFPEGVVNEDIALITCSLATSRAVTVIPEVVYYWRIREDGKKSLSQSNSSAKNFIDRLLAIETVEAFFKERSITAPSILRMKNYKWLNHDLGMFLWQVRGREDEYSNLIYDKLFEFIQTHDLTESDFAKTQIEHQIRYDSIRKGDREGFFRVCARIMDKQVVHSMIHGKGAALYARYPGVDRNFLLAEAIRRAPIPRGMIRMARQGDAVEITGYGINQYLACGTRRAIEAKAFLVHENGGETPLACTPVKDADMAQKHGVRMKTLIPKTWQNDHTYAAVSVVLPLSALTLCGVYRIRVGVAINGNHYTYYMGETETCGSLPLPGRMAMSGDKACTIALSDKLDLTITAQSLQNAAEAIAFENGMLAVSLRARDALVSSTPIMVMESAKTFPFADRGETYREICGTVNEFDGEATLVFPIAEADISAGQRWRLQWKDAEGKRTNIPPSLPWTFARQRIGSLCLGATEEKGALVFSVTPGNHLALKMEHTGSLLSLHTEDRYPELSTELLSQSDFVLRLLCLENGKMIDIPGDVEADGRHTLRGLFAFDLFDAQNPVLKGTWTVSTLLLLPDGRIVQKNLYGTEFHQQTVTREDLGREAILRSSEEGLRLTVRLRTDIIHAGPRKSAIFRHILFPLMHLLPVRRKQVLFEVNGGSDYLCNPRAMYDYIRSIGGYKCIWSFTDEMTPIDGDAIRVRRDGLRFYYYLLTSKYFINNLRCVPVKKKKRTIDIYTMHGTPLKKMGFDVVGEDMTDPDVRNIQTAVTRWNHVVSMSAYDDDVIRQAYHYDKNILQTGYPRNDFLFAHATDERLQRSIRDSLRIPEGKKVILYAPTFREVNNFTLALDVRRLKERFGEEYVLVMRMHYYTTAKIDPQVYDAFTINGNAVKDIRDLYLISDLLITDYSSSMFDYAILKRPILLYTYDYKRYMNERGTYCDIREDYPGLICDTMDEVIHALENQDGLMPDVLRMNARFDEYERGDACERIYAEVFGGPFPKR